MNLSNFISLVFKNKILLVLFILIPLISTFFIERFYNEFNKKNNEFKYSIEVKLENNIDEYLRRYHIINTGYEAKDLDLVMYYKHIYAFATNFISKNIILQDKKIKGLDGIEILSLKKIDFEINPLGGLQTIIRIIIKSKDKNYEKINSFFKNFEEKLKDKSIFFLKEKQKLNTEILEINKSIYLSKFKKNYYKYLQDLIFRIEDVKREHHIELNKERDIFDDAKRNHNIVLNKERDIFEKIIKKANDEIKIIEMSIKYSDSFKGKFAFSENYCSPNQILFCNVAFPKNYNIEKLEYLLQNQNLKEIDYEIKKTTLSDSLEEIKSEYEIKKTVISDSLEEIKKAFDFIQISKEKIKKLDFDSKFDVNNSKSIKTHFYTFKKEFNNLNKVFDDFNMKFYILEDNDIINELDRLNNIPSIQISKVKKIDRHNFNIVTLTNLNEESQIKQINRKFYLALLLFLSLSIYSMILIFRFKDSK